METHWFFWWVEDQARCLHRVEYADGSDGKDEYERDHCPAANFNSMNMIYNIFHQKPFSLIVKFPSTSLRLCYSHLLRLVERFVVLVERFVPASLRFFRQVPSALRVLGSFPSLTYGPCRGPARLSVAIRFSSCLMWFSTATITSLLKERLFSSAIRFRASATSGGR